MDVTRSETKKKGQTARRMVSERLRRFYGELKGIVSIDADDFYRRVMEQARAGQGRETRSHA